MSYMLAAVLMSNQPVTFTVHLLLGVYCTDFEHVGIYFGSSARFTWENNR